MKKIKIYNYKTTQSSRVMFAWCIAHTLVRYELGLIFRHWELKTEFLLFIAIMFGFIPLCCTDDSTKGGTVLIAD